MHAPALATPLLVLLVSERAFARRHLPHGHSEGDRSIVIWHVPETPLPSQEFPAPPQQGALVVHTLLPLILPSFSCMQRWDGGMEGWREDGRLARAGVPSGRC